MITQSFLQKTQRLKVFPEVSPGNHGFLMFNDGGVEVEVAEFLYSLVRMLKPEYVVETGTHLGISSSYIGQALIHNNKGSMITFEIIPELLANARALWNDLGVPQVIEARLQPSLGSNITRPIDLLFLDSEPQLRFDEFIKFWPQVKDGGFILIHDLHPSMGHHGQTYHGTYDWPYGDFREKLGSFLKERKVQTIHFPTPRGFTLFQKVDSAFEVDKYLRGE